MHSLNEFQIFQINPSIYWEERGGGGVIFWKINGPVDLEFMVIDLLC